MKIAIILLGVAAVVLVALLLLTRSHDTWLDRQSPSGSWVAMTPSGDSILLTFRGGPAEGTYEQIVASPNGKVREFGHWRAYRNELALLIMATDQPDHPRFGIDTQYRITYPGPNSITINGPDRSQVTFVKAGTRATSDTSAT